jgi:hypothetical protein
MNYYLVNYKIKYYDDATYVGGFDHPEDLTHPILISLEQFKNNTFLSSDVIVIPLFSMHTLFDPDHRDQFVQFIKENFNFANFYRKNSIVIFGNPRELLEDPSQSYESHCRIVLNKINKDNQKSCVILNLNQLESSTIMAGDGYCLDVVKQLIHSMTDIKSFTAFEYFDLDTNIDFVSGEIIVENNIKKYQNQIHRDFLYTCLNRRMDGIRSYVLYQLYDSNLFDFGQISYDFSLSFDYTSFLEGTTTSRYENFMSTHNFNKIDNEDIRLNQAFGLVPSHYNDSYVQLINESYISNQYSFISEKTFKSILCGSPFLILGCKNSINHLQDIGFITFSDWWDETYDNLNNFENRIRGVLQILDRLSKYKKDDLNILFSEQTEILRHNYNHLIQLISNNNYIYDCYSHIIDVEYGDSIKF